MEMMFDNSIIGRYKNGMVNRAFNMMLDPTEISDDFDECFSVIAAFAYGMLSTADSLGLKLDLTYDTANNLKTVIENLWFVEATASPAEVYDNIHTVAKVPAAYLILMALNEHDCDVAVGVDSRDDGGNSTIDRWAFEYKIRLASKGILEKTKDDSDIEGMTEDILFAMLESIAIETDGEIKNCIIEVKPIIEAYKKICGVDLGKFGMRNIRMGGTKIYS